MSLKLHVRIRFGFNEMAKHGTRYHEQSSLLVFDTLNKKFSSFSLSEVVVKLTRIYYRSVHHPAGREGG